jgi:hypothetical protein
MHFSWVVVPSRQATQAGWPVLQIYAKVDNIAQSVAENLASVLTGTYDDLTKTTMSYNNFFISKCLRRFFNLRRQTLKQTFKGLGHKINIF